MWYLILPHWFRYKSKPCLFAGVSNLLLHPPHPSYTILNTDLKPMSTDTLGNSCLPIQVCVCVHVHAPALMNICGHYVHCVYTCVHYVCTSEH